MEINIEIIDSPYLNLPGLPPMNKNEYNQRKTPPCLTGLLGDKYLPYSDDCGNFELTLAQHIGKPIPFSDEHVLNPGDHYLDLTLKECDDLKDAINSLNELAQFVKEYKNINWLVAVSWLGSVKDGKLVERYGFHKTNTHIPYLTHKDSKGIGLERKNPTQSYLKLVKESKPVFIYAPRDEFLSHFHV